jgi:type II secretion system protein H
MDALAAGRHRLTRGSGQAHEWRRDGNLSGDSSIVIPAQAGIQIFGARTGSRPTPGRPGLGKTKRTEHHPSDVGTHAIAPTRGFTLIEILVVCAIVAILATLVMLRLEHSDASRLNDAAEDLTRRLEAARDEAVISGKSIAFSSDGNGYQFWLADTDRNAWIPLPASETMAAGRFASGIVLSSLRINGSARPLGERVVFSPFGLGEAFALTLAIGSSRIDVQADVLGRLETRHAP